ncbi:MAG: flavin reductase [Firmicutes bacterium]|nr:flavin reductase [Bacillota bacterium]
MKKNFYEKPETLKERWPGAFVSVEGSWFNELLCVPSPIALVTGWKSNGKENACLQGNITFAGTNGEMVCTLGWVHKGHHAYESLKETGCCVVNLFSPGLKDKCFNTIENNGFDTDEITAAGLTAEKALKVNAPRIKECFMNVECEYLWEQELLPGKSPVYIIGLKVVNICLDEEYFDTAKRFGKDGFYCLADGTNPENGEVYTFEGGLSN